MSSESLNLSEYADSYEKPSKREVMMHEIRKLKVKVTASARSVKKFTTGGNCIRVPNVPYRGGGGGYRPPHTRSRNHCNIIISNQIADLNRYNELKNSRNLFISVFKF